MALREHLSLLIWKMEPSTYSKKYSRQTDQPVI